MLQQQLGQAHKMLSDMHENYDKLKTLSSSEDLETQLSNIQRKMCDVRSEFGSIDIIKMHYTEEVSFAYIRRYIVLILIISMQ